MNDFRSKTKRADEREQFVASDIVVYLSEGYPGFYTGELFTNGELKMRLCNMDFREEN